MILMMKRLDENLSIKLIDAAKTENCFPHANIRMNYPTSNYQTCVITQDMDLFTCELF